MTITRDQWREIHTTLWALYPSARLDTSTVEAYWTQVRSYPHEAVRVGVRRLVAERAERRYPPSWPEMAEYIRTAARSIGGAMGTPPVALLSEAPLAATLGPDHPATRAIESARGTDGQIDGRAAVAAIIAMVTG